MALDRDLLKQFRDLETRMEGVAVSDDLCVFTTIAEVLAYTAQVAREGGVIDEADAVELAAYDLGRDELRNAEAVLRPLGYRLICDRLKVMSRRRRAN